MQTLEVPIEEKVKFPRAVVAEVFHELWRLLDPDPSIIWEARWPEAQSAGPLARSPHALCERLCAVGGYRRGKREMKDIELLYIPRMIVERNPETLLEETREVNATDRLWDELVRRGVFAKRLKKTGAISAWGPENKHALHVASGLAVDLFSTTAEHWHNRLVCTTGSMESNIRIAKAARAMVPNAWEWEMAAGGFVPLGKTWATAPRERRTMRSEREVFEFVGLPFLPPEGRS